MPRFFGREVCLCAAWTDLEKCSSRRPRRPRGLFLCYERMFKPLVSLVPYVRPVHQAYYHGGDARRALLSVPAWECSACSQTPRCIRDGPRHADMVCPRDPGNAQEVGRRRAPCRVGAAQSEHHHERGWNTEAFDGEPPRCADRPGASCMDAQVFRCGAHGISCLTLG